MDRFSMDSSRSGARFAGDPRSPAVATPPQGGAASVRVARYKKIVEDLEKELNDPKQGIDAQIDRALVENDGDVNAEPVRRLQERKNKLGDDYRAAVQAYDKAQKDDADEQSREARRKAAQEYRKKRGSAPPKTQSELISDLEAAHALGEIDDNEVIRRRDAWIADNITIPGQQEAKTAAAQRQRESDARAASAEGRAERGEARADRGETRAEAAASRAEANTARQLSQSETSTRINVRQEARAAGKDARERASQGLNDRRVAAQARAIAGGASPQDALKAAYAEADIDIDKITDEAVNRALADLMGRSPTPTPGAPPRSTPTPTPPPTPAPVPTGVGAAATLGAAQASGTMVPPDDPRRNRFSYAGGGTPVQ